MAIVGNNPYMAWEEPLTHYEYAIQGQMFMVSYEIHDSVTQSYNDWRNETKKRLSLELATIMLEAGVIEFTQTDNLHSGHKTIRARCYLVPDDRVRLLRTLYKDK